MDATRFDAIAKALVSETNRRRTLGGLLSGALAALGLPGADEAGAAKSGKCKKDCGLCEFCKLGKCRKTKSGKKVCKKGKCKPQENGTACASAGGTCQSGTCVCTDGKANCGATCCRADQECQNGTCACPAGSEECNGACVALCAEGTQARNPANCSCCFVAGIPVCLAPGGVPTPSAICCSQLCLPIGGGPAGSCAPGANGTPCSVNGQCTSNNCVNGLCAA